MTTFHIKHENPAGPNMGGVTDPHPFLMCLKVCPDGPLGNVCCFLMAGAQPAESQQSSPGGAGGVTR